MHAIVGPFCSVGSALTWPVMQQKLLVKTRLSSSMKELLSHVTFTCNIEERHKHYGLVQSYDDGMTVA